jgi:hypothetical protein
MAGESYGGASSGATDVSGLDADSIKDELIGLVGGGLVYSSRKRTLVNELLLKLEAVNPTRAPAYSPLLNGPWEFLYTGGISPGMLGKTSTPGFLPSYHSSTTSSSTAPSTSSFTTRAAAG